MDVALDRADHHGTHARRTGFGQQGLEDEHAALHGIGGQQNLGNEQDTVAEVVADDGHATHQRLGQDTVGSPAAFQQNVHRLFDLFLETVIEVVEHLLDEFFVIQFGQDDVVFFVRHGAIPLLWHAGACRVLNDYSLFLS